MKEERQAPHEEKQAAGEIVVENRFVRWLDNLWYHHNWKILIIAFFILVFIVCIVQCSGKEVNDVTLTFAGPVDFQAEDKSLGKIRDVLGLLIRSESGEETRTVGIPHYSVYTEEELRALYTDEDGNFSQYGYSGAVDANRKRIETLSTYFNTGACAVWLVNEFTYEYLHMKDRAVPLTETFKEVPGGAYDECAVRLGDTELYRYYEALQVLPADTLVVLTRKYVLGASDDTEYRQATELYRAMLEFRAP